MPKRLPPDFAKHDRAMTKMLRYRQEFVLAPHHFTMGAALPALAWQTVTLNKAGLASVVSKPGLYALSIVAGRIGLPPHGYVMYVGQTGAKKDRRTLRARAGEYVREEISGKRVKIWDLLNKWKGHLVFHFAAVDPNVEDLLALERTLNDALMPPCSENDFSPEIKRQKKAWQSA